MRRLILLCVGMSCGCQRASPQRAECPPERALEELHAAAFYLERGDRNAGETRLSAARKLMLTANDPRADELLRDLTRAAASDDDPRVMTERARLALSTWRCLDDDLHRRFHEGLPDLQQ